MRRLAIIVPYRDRAQHLATFIPHVSAYFARDKLDREVPYRVIVVEQQPGLPFNRGALLNAGVSLVGDSVDYVCLHDVDYLPLWADYGWADEPTPIVWHGAEVRPIAPGISDVVFSNVMESFFGGAVLIPVRDFRAVDGMSNDYWGWGYEDDDLRARFQAAGIRTGRRRGTFAALDHRHNGYELVAAGVPVRELPIAKVNQRRYDALWSNPRRSRPPEGLTTLGFDIVRRELLHGMDHGRAAVWEKVTVHFHHQPGSDAFAAAAAVDS